MTREENSEILDYSRTRSKRIATEAIVTLTSAGMPEVEATAEVLDIHLDALAQLTAALIGGWEPDPGFEATPGVDMIVALLSEDRP